VKGWFKHGKWPKWMIYLHYYTIISFAVLMLTGLALFLPFVHEPLIPYLPIIYYIHIVLGIIFGVTLLITLAVHLPVGKRIRRFDWLIPSVFGMAIVITGIFIWGVTLFPTTWRNLAFHWHAWMAYTLAAWVLIHAVYKAIGYRPSNDGINARVDPSRRMFLKWIGTGLTGAVVLSIVDPVGLLKRTLNFQNTTARPVGSPPQFAAFYTVTGGYPSADLSTYRLRVDGLVGHPVTLKWSDITALSLLQKRTDFHCVTGWSVPNVEWKGIHLRAFVSLVNPLPKVKYVHFYSFDGVYTESLSMSNALGDSVMLAYELDGQPLSNKQGFPLRLVVPKMYGYKSIKWVNRVEFSDEPIKGYWEARGYADEAYLGNGM
jgi:DMSO/TMAO reductase YedYZ molybdopterin-dependent catalytic subunit